MSFRGSRMRKVIYLIGSLRNDKIPALANWLERETKHEVFCSWFSPGPEADDYWRKYAIARGMSYQEALEEYSATHIFEFDKHHLDRANMAVLVAPAGKSGHLELGYMIGRGKPCFYLMEEENIRWDIMLQFCFLNGGNVCKDGQELINCINNYTNHEAIETRYYYGSSQTS